MMDSSQESEEKKVEEQETSFPENEKGNDNGEIANETEITDEESVESNDDQAFLLSGFPGIRYVPVSPESPAIEEEKETGGQSEEEWKSEALVMPKPRSPAEAVERLKREGRADWLARFITFAGFLLVFWLGYVAVNEKWYENPDAKMKSFTTRVKMAYALLLHKPTGFKIIKKVKKVKEVYYTCPDDPQVEESEPGECPIDGQKLVKKERWVEKEVEEKVPVYNYGGTGSVKGADEGETKTDEKEKDYYYTCSMHPQVIEDEPGDCPICGMKLTRKERKKKTTVKTTKSDTNKDQKKEKVTKNNQAGQEGHKPEKSIASEDEEKNLITVDPRMRQILGIVSVPVKISSLVKKINTVGKIEYDEKSIKTATSRLSGRLDKLYINYTGVKVRKGQPLARIYSPELVTTQKEYLLALDTLEKLRGSDIEIVRENAESLVKAAERRMKLWELTDKQIKIIRETGKVRDHITVYSPVAGTVIDLKAVEGIYVREGTPLYRIANLSRVWVQADIYEYDMEWIRKGQAVELEIPAYPGRKFYGIISFIDPFTDEKTRTTRVRIEVNNRHGLLKPGMYAKAIIKSRLAGSSLMIPESAVIRTGKRDIVFLDLGEGKILPREVTLGHLISGKYEVKSGLSSRQKVIISANFLLNSESQMQETIRRMMEQADSSGGDRKKPMPPGHQH